MPPIAYYALGTVFVFFGLIFFSLGSILSGGLSFLIGIYIVNRGVKVSWKRQGKYDDPPEGVFEEDMKDLSSNQVPSEGTPGEPSPHEESKEEVPFSENLKQEEKTDFAQAAKKTAGKEKDFTGTENKDEEK